MNIEYKRDLYNNYMVIREWNEGLEDTYCNKILCYHNIEGILQIEIRRIDDKTLYYYNITGKQPLYHLFEKGKLSYSNVKNIFTGITSTIELAHEYLLIEDDFVLLPEYIYLDISKDIPYLSYLSGYQKNAKEQIKVLIEYIMNKVDYSDSNAVLLVYNLYAICREEDFTLQDLRNIIRKSQEIGQQSCVKVIHKREADSLEKEKEVEEVLPSTPTIDQKITKKLVNIPMMKEKITGEKEVSSYTLTTYMLTFLCVIGGVILLLASFASKLVYNSLGNRIDFSKLIPIIILLISIEGYLLKNIWDKKNKISKVVSKEEYIDPVAEEYCNMKYSSVIKDNNNKKHSETIVQGDNHLENIENIENKEVNPTWVLNEDEKSTCYILKPLQPECFKGIELRSFPFFVGKLKHNVDYYLENNAVSRYHAKITKEGECLYLTDLNSTNGTFINNTRLIAYQKEKLKLGDEVTLANIKFILEE